VHDARVLARLSSPAFLWAGVVAPLLFTLIYLVDGATRAGYDPLRHQVSLLSLGDRGWLQTLSFLVTGGLLVVFGIALRAWLRSGPGARAVPGGVAVAGIGLVLAGLFPTQPLFGYPPGTPDGMSAAVEPASYIHVGAAFLAFFGLAAAALAMAVRLWRADSKAWAIASAMAGVVVIVAFGASGGGPSGELLFPTTAGLIQRIALSAGLGWVLAVAVFALRSPVPAAARG
jgi:hypothetical membrane protein